MADKIVRPDSLFCDGGICGANPSPVGGSWAWCWVRDGECVLEGAGTVTPRDCGLAVVGNNLTELLAAVSAVESVLHWWPEFDGQIYTDSKVTLHRLLGSSSFEGVPDFLVQRCLKARSGRRFQVKLVAGHPTDAELAAGRSRPRLGFFGNGVLASPHNVRVDQLCQEQCRRLFISAVRPTADKRERLAALGWARSVTAYGVVWHPPGRRGVGVPEPEAFDVLETIPGRRTR